MLTDPKLLQRFLITVDHYGQLMRLNKPIGTLLLLWPTLTALIIASHGNPSAFLLVIFIGGTFVMRAAGCVLNDFFDRHIDGAIARTRHRPLAQKKITPRAALITAALLLAIAGLLLVQLNTLSRQIGLIGAALTAFYPLCKRFTHYPQIVLGVVFNLGILLAFAAVTNALPLAAWLLYLAALSWTIAYDTMYAMVDREDDKKAGVKSIAIAFGRHDRLGIAIFQLLTCCLLLAVGVVNHYQHGFYIGILLSGLFMLYQQLLLTSQQPARWLQAFLNNNWAWLMIFLATLLTTR